MNANAEQIALLAPPTPDQPGWAWIAQARWNVGPGSRVIRFRSAVLPSDLNRFATMNDVTGSQALEILRAWLPLLGQWRSVRLRDGRTIYQSSEDWYRFGFYHLGGTVERPPAGADFGPWKGTLPPPGREKAQADPPKGDLDDYVLRLYREVQNK